MPQDTAVRALVSNLKPALFLTPSYTKKLPAAGFKFETKFFSCETVLPRKNADAI